MAAEDQDARTEPPTARRRREARAEGQVARSNDLSSSVILLGGLLSLYFLGGRIFGRMVVVMRACLGNTDESVIRPDSLMASGVAAISDVGISMLPMLGAVVVVSILISLIQVGWCPTLKPIKPRLDKLNPITGAKRLLISPRTLVMTGMNLAKMTVVAAVAYFTLRARLADVVGAAGLDHIAVMLLMGKMLFDLAIRLSIVLFLLALIDYAYQRYQHEKGLKMTKQEVKDEYKSMEGDPKLKSRRRQVQIELALQRMKAAVPTADVVITNPTEIAVALKYDESAMAAPRVVAKGKGFVAQRIRELAIEHRIPIVEKKPLAQALYRTVEVGQEVPPQFYRAVAEILAYVFELAGKGSRRMAGAPA